MFNQLHKHWESTKRVLGDGFHGAVKLAGQFDRGMNLGRRLLHSLSPAINHLGGQHHFKAIDEGFQRYDSARSDVMQNYNKVQFMHNKLKREMPELNL